MESKVLFYNLWGKNKAEKIARYLKEKRIVSIPVEKADYHRSLGDILEIPGFTVGGLPEAAGDFSDEMLVMFNFTEDMLDDFLAFFRSGEAEPVALKAIVTPTNISWNSLKLYNEISEEHRTMSKK